MQDSKSHPWWNQSLFSLLQVTVFGIVWCSKSSIIVSPPFFFDDVYISGGILLNGITLCVRSYFGYQFYQFSSNQNKKRKRILWWCKSNISGSKLDDGTCIIAYQLLIPHHTYSYHLIGTSMIKIFYNIPFIFQVKSKNFLFVFFSVAKKTKLNCTSTLVLAMCYAMLNGTFQFHVQKNSILSLSRSLWVSSSAK